MISFTLIRAIRAQYQLEWRGIHGIDHWARVLENGLRVAASVNARVEVVELFAVFHDACRVNDGHDPAHGLRGAMLAQHYRGTYFDISDADFKLLYEACAYHTDGRTRGDPVLQSCWDADRLDLGRVGIHPYPTYLCTDEAKKDETIAWAYARSVSLTTPIKALEWAQA
ncbi:MAG: hypothetical protein WCT04_04905 [Planctomycetota bacterium]